MTKNQSPTMCKHCHMPHPSYDYHGNPSAKNVLLELRKRYEKLPPNERMFRMENWAVRKGLRRNAVIRTFQPKDVKGNPIGEPRKKPEGGNVVMCGYGKLVEADKWLGSFNEFDQKIADSQAVDINPLPF